MALLTLEAEGVAMRGRYRSMLPPGAAEEWCDRRLLARIHRHTLQRLREQVEPVSPAVLMQFLFAWHGLGEERAEGAEAVRRALQKLRGFPAPAAAWESSLLPARIERYAASDLDAVLGSGQFVWLRAGAEPGPGQRKAGPVRSTPIVFLDRAEAGTWMPLLAATSADDAPLSSAARAIRSALASRGAMFFVDLVRVTGLLRTQVEQGLSELVAWGLVTSDSFTGLRALITPASRRASFSRPVRGGSVSVDSAGRWSLVERADLVAPAAEEERPADTPVAIARTLLERYGVVFRALLRREAWFLPPWRELARVYRRLEARGEIRGGRFVNGFSGEQFALPEAVEDLRAIRRQMPERGTARTRSPCRRPTRSICAGSRHRARECRRHRAIACFTAAGCRWRLIWQGKSQWLVPPDPRQEWAARNLLIRSDRERFYLPGAPRQN